MKNRPIGIFDSGLGGLTAVKEIIKIMPNENIVYFGDVARGPYGNKNPETILKYTIQEINFLKSKDVKMVVAACGTISSVLVDTKLNIGLPFIDVLFPTCKSAIESTKSGRIGVIGTTTTIKSNAYKKMIHSINSDMQIFQKDCPLLAPMIENQLIDNSSDDLRMLTKQYLSYFDSLNIDTLIMGCTHYPIISDIIADIIGYDVKLINSGQATAFFIKNQLFKQNLENSNKNTGVYDFYISKNIDVFSHNAKKYLHREVTPKVIDITIF